MPEQLLTWKMIKLVATIKCEDGDEIQVNLPTDFEDATADELKLAILEEIDRMAGIEYPKTRH